MMRPTQTRHIPRTILTLTAASLAGAAAGAGEPIHTDGAGIDAVETNENVTPVEPRPVYPGPRVTDAAVGLIDVVQINNENQNESVELRVPAGARLFSFTKQNRGDYHLGFGTGDDLANGVVLVAPRQLERTNTTGQNAGGNIGGDRTATVSIHRKVDARDQFVAVHGAPSGSEMNLDIAAVFFPFDKGFVGGHTLNGGVNNAPMTEIVASNDIRLNADFVDLQGIDGVYTLNLDRSGYDADDGVLLVNGADNEDNFALSRPEPDGTFRIYCKDNGNNAAGFENDPVAFVFLPFDLPGLVAGQIAENSGAAPTILKSTGGFRVSPFGEGGVLVRIDGVTDGTSGALLVSPQGGGTRTQDN